MPKKTSGANGQDKADRFTRVATKRVSRALDGIHRIGNLSNTNVYGYQPEQIDKMFNAMRAELDAAQDRFIARSGGTQFGFSFD